MQIPLSAKTGRNQSKQNTIAVGCMLLIFLLMAGGCSLVKIEEGERTAGIHCGGNSRASFECTGDDSGKERQRFSDDLSKRRYGVSDQRIRKENEWRLQYSGSGIVCFIYGSFF